MTVEEAGILWRSYGGKSFGAPSRLLSMAPRIGDDELLVCAYCEAAHDGLRGIWFTEQIARERIARIRERFREYQKQQERPTFRMDRSLHRLSVSSLLAQLGGGK